MLTKRIIPCLDIKDGKVVKGINFVNLKDAGDPVEVAAFYNKEGADEICCLDITATVETRKNRLQIIKDISKNVFVPLCVGGGITHIEDIRDCLFAGADKVAINSSAIKNPDIVEQGANRFGSQCIVVAIDAKRVGDSWQLFTHGGRTPTGIDALSWVKNMEHRGAGEFLVTSMDADGTKKGFDNDLMRAITDIVRVPVIASGGAGNMEHMVDGILKGRADAVLAASIFHYKEYSIAETKRYMQQAGISVRI